MSESQLPAVRPTESAAMRKCAVVSLFFVLAACGSSTEPEPIWGTYDLQSVAGQPLPSVLTQEGTSSIEASAGQMWLNSDMTFSQSLTFRYTSSVGAVTTATETDTGTFTVSGSTLTFTSSDPGLDPYTGSLVGNTLTIVEEWFAVAFVYVKP